MKLSDKQALMLFDIAKDSLSIADGGQVFGYNIEQRRQLVNMVINQQSDRLVDLEPAPTPQTGEGR